MARRFSGAVPLRHGRPPDGSGPSRGVAVLGLAETDSPAEAVAARSAPPTAEARQRSNREGAWLREPDHDGRSRRQFPLSALQVPPDLSRRGRAEKPIGREGTNL